MIGEFKLEDTIKIRGKRLSESLFKNDVIQMEIQDVNENNSFISAQGAGAGKTYNITQKFIDSPMDSKFLNPTHTSNKNIEKSLLSLWMICRFLSLFFQHSDITYTFINLRRNFQLYYIWNTNILF